MLGRWHSTGDPLCSNQVFVNQSGVWCNATFISRMKIDKLEATVMNLRIETSF